MSILLAGNSAQAALPRAQLALGLDRLPAHEGAPTGIRVAQSGPLDGLFSIFKPKPKRQMQRLPEAPMSSRTGKAGTLPLSQSNSGAASIGADGYPIIVRPAPRPRSAVSGGSRTMCVRLCDGYYWPATSGTRSTNIARDQNICEQSCEAETKLFIRPSLGADAGDMRDLSGKPYKKLKTAFLYRKTYVPECKCRPDPWSSAEQLRHEEYRAAAAGTLSGDPGGTASAMVDRAADDDTLTPIEGDSSDIDLATGNGEDDAVRVASVTPEPQAVSLPSTAPRLPKVRKTKAKSTATLGGAAANTKAAAGAKKKPREPIGRVIR